MRQVLRRVRKRKRVAAVTIAAVVSLSRTVSPAAAVLGWVNRLPARELYVVTDDPVHFRRARRRTKATVVFLPQPTDEWTLRAFGTRLAAKIRPSGQPCCGVSRGLCGGGRILR